MIKDILKILWNYRKLYLGIYIEQICVFIILMISIVSLIDAINKYNSPGLLDTNNVISFGYVLGSEGYNSESVQKEVVHSMDLIASRLAKEPYVVAVSNNLQFTPYLRDDNEYHKDSIEIDNTKHLIYIKSADVSAAKVYKPKVIRGSWFTSDNEKLDNGNTPIIITQQLSELLKWGNSVGRIINTKGNKLEVIGVVEGVKQTPFVKSPNAIIYPARALNSPYFREMAVRIKSGYKDEFLTKLHKEFYKEIDKQRATLFSVDLDVTRKFFMKEITYQIVMYLIPTIFLLLFAFIGTFGLFLIVTKRRMSEYAVRIALGATKMKLQLRIIIESLIITSLASVPGIILCFFIYEVNSLNILSIMVALVIIQLFSILSVLYATRKIAIVQPTEILRQK